MTKKRLSGALTAISFAALIYLIGWSSLFSISTVNIETKDPKNIPLIESQLKRFDQEIAIGDPMARINTRAIERSLKAQTWIGEVRIERDWLQGSVSLVVKERIPLFKVERFGREVASYDRSFMSTDGELFQLPGDLADEYQSLPTLELQSESLEDRISAITLFESINRDFPVKSLRVSGISRFVSELRHQDRTVQVTWGTADDIDRKALVLSELLNLPANKRVSRIDVGNPELPIVSN